MLFISVRQLLDKNSGFWCVNLLPSDHSGEAPTGPLRGGPVHLMALLHGRDPPSQRRILASLVFF